jgi:hypothetical protein
MGSNVSATSSAQKGVLQSQQSMTLTKDQVAGDSTIGGATADGESDATK